MPAGLAANHLVPDQPVVPPLTALRAGETYGAKIGIGLFGFGIVFPLSPLGLQMLKVGKVGDRNND